MSLSLAPNSASDYRAVMGAWVGDRDRDMVTVRNRTEIQFVCNCIGLSRYTAITYLSIIPVFLEYLCQFLIDLNQIYRHSSVPKNMSPCIL